MLNIPQIDHAQPTAALAAFGGWLSGDGQLYHKVMQNFATRVIRSLDKLGSNVKVFSIMPNGFPPDIVWRLSVNTAKRRWPQCYYLKSRDTEGKAVALLIRGGLRE